jgi:hypothetical protein
VTSRQPLGRAWPRGTSLGKARGGSDAEAALVCGDAALARAGARPRPISIRCAPVRTRFSPKF